MDEMTKRSMLAEPSQDEISREIDGILSGETMPIDAYGVCGGPGDAKKPALVSGTVLQGDWINEMRLDYDGKEHTSPYVPSIGPNDPVCGSDLIRIDSNGGFFLDSFDDVDSSGAKPMIIEKPVLQGVVENERGEVLYDPFSDRVIDMNQQEGSNEHEIEFDATYIGGDGKIYGKSVCVNNTVLQSGTQWYETNPRLFREEIAAMKHFNPNARYGFDKKTGNMYWLANVRPRLTPNCWSSTVYTLRLEYMPDHPGSCMGTSVHCFPVKPSLSDMQNMVNASNVVPKTICHTIRSEDGERRYLCTTDPEHATADRENGITTATTSLGFATRWLKIFELGLRSQKMWDLFQDEGKV